MMRKLKFITLAFSLLAALTAQASFSLKQTVQTDPSLASAFGTLETAELTPVVQMDFVHGINIQSGATNTANGGTVGTTNGLLLVQAGTTASGDAIFKSLRPVRYRAGQGTVARFTTIFSSAGTNNLQIIGAGNELDGYFFAVTNNTYGIIYRNAGADTWIPFSAWNGTNNLAAANFQPGYTNGQVCMVKYPFLGFGDINFFLEDPISARFILVHTIRYAGSTNVVQITNPNLSFYAESKTYTGGGTNAALCKVGSVGFFISGPRSFVSNPKWAQSSGFKTGVQTTETILLTLRNATNFNGSVNRSMARLNSISYGTTLTSAGAYTINFYYNTAAGGSPSFTAVNGTLSNNSITNGSSVISYDTAGTTVSGGNKVFSLCGAGGVNNNSQNFTIDLSPFDLYVGPGDTLTVSIVAPTGTVSALVTLTWTEDI